MKPFNLIVAAALFCGARVILTQTRTQETSVSADP